MSESISKTIDDGGTAFPCDEYTKDGNHFRCHTGMSLLDYYAGMALHSVHWRSYQNKKDTARECYAMAIEMLNERERINAST
mgnify:CR=1 FL=1